MKTGDNSIIVVAVLALMSLISARLPAQECGSADSAFGKPPAGVDAIVVVVEGGRPYFKYLASIDSMGRALFLPDASRPGQTRVSMLSSSLFQQLAARVKLAAEADQKLEESAQLDTATLEGLLEAIRQGAALGCTAHQDGIDRHVTVYVAGEETHYECVGGQLSEFNQQVVDILSDAVNETGELLCP